MQINSPLGAAEWFGMSKTGMATYARMRVRSWKPFEIFTSFAMGTQRAVLYCPLGFINDIGGKI